MVRRALSIRVERVLVGDTVCGGGLGSAYKSMPGATLYRTQQRRVINDHSRVAYAEIHHDDGVNEGVTDQGPTTQKAPGSETGTL